MAAIVLVALVHGHAVPFQSGNGPFLDPVGLQADRGYFSELLGVARHPGLRDAVDQLFRADAKIGDGSSMAAYMYEKATGQLLSKSGHLQKLTDRLAQLRALLRRRDLIDGDRTIAERLVLEIERAIK